MIDFERIRKIYKLGRNLSLSDIQVLFKAASIKSIEAGDYLIQRGELKKDVFFIRSGLVRVFTINDRGDEITTLIRWENQVIASADIILFDQPAEQYYQCLEPTEVFAIDYDRLQEIIDRNPKLEANRKHMLLNILKEALLRIDSFVLLTPEERYLSYIKTKPDIANRVPDKYLANVLGITPVSLSRIRKRIASRK